MDEIAEVELTGGMTASEACTQLAGGVVDEPLSPAAAVECRRVDTCYDAGMVGVAAFTRSPGWAVFAVVHLVSDDGAVVILRSSALDEFDDDLAPAPDAFSSG